LGRKTLSPILPLPKGKGEEKGGGWEYKISPSLILPLQRRGERGEKYDYLTKSFLKRYGS